MSQLNNAKNNDEVAQEVLKAIKSLQFGSIEIIVHEGKVTQIELREKVRFRQEINTKKPTAISAAK
jgi:hypothetical protein